LDLSLFDQIDVYLKESSVGDRRKIGLFMNNEVFLWEWKKFVEEDEEKKNMFLLVEWNSRVARTSVEEKREEKVMVVV
jgi:hypothetical protein